MLSAAVPSASAARPFPMQDTVHDEQAIKVVLGMLAEHMAMDVVFVGDYTDGPRRFRVVEALSHGPTAAAATCVGDTCADNGALLDAPIVLRSGRVHGRLCCLASADAATRERQLRSLRHGARLAARLLDNEQVLRELARQAAAAEATDD